MRKKRKKPEKPEGEQGLDDAPLLDDVFNWGGEVEGRMVDGFRPPEGPQEEEKEDGEGEGAGAGEG